MDCGILKDKLLELGVHLTDIDKDLQNQMSELEKLEEKWKVMDNEAAQISRTDTNIVTLNIGGIVFQTSIKTLLNIKDTMFYKIVLSKTFDMSQEIYLDRSPRFFHYILDFLRYQKFDYKRFTSEQQVELLDEANYYELTQMIDVLSHRTKKIEFVTFEVNSHYQRSGTMVGTGRLEDLSDRSQMRGFALTSPGWIIIELNNDWEFNELEIGGFRGNSTFFSAENGVGAKIETSLNKVTWNNVGAIPSGFGSAIKKVTLIRSTARYIKITATGYLGIGFLEINKL